MLQYVTFYSCPRGQIFLYKCMNPECYKFRFDTIQQNVTDRNLALNSVSHKRCKTFRMKENLIYRLKTRHMLKKKYSIRHLSLFKHNNLLHSISGFSSLSNSHVQEHKTAQTNSKLKQIILKKNISNYK